jgi:CRP/FNR family transcriptional regulator, nitrogen oxide reductase regulator
LVRGIGGIGGLQSKLARRSALSTRRSKSETVAPARANEAISHEIERRDVALQQGRGTNGPATEASAMSGVDRSIVAGLKPFAGWPAADLDALLAPAHARRFDKGAAVFEQGAPAESFFLLLDGHVQASKLTPDGRQIIVRYIDPGELFGIAAQIRETTYPATAKAVVESLALAWPSSIWPELAAKFPALSSGLLQSVGARLADANARMMEMATEPVERRLAHALLRLTARAGRSVDGGVEIDFPITRQDLGEMVGTTLFTVSRLLSGWETEGLVESGRARIVVRRPDRLAAIAEGGGAE